MLTSELKKSFLSLYTPWHPDEHGPNHTTLTMLQQVADLLCVSISRLFLSAAYLHTRSLLEADLTTTPVLLPAVRLQVASTTAPVVRRTVRWCWIMAS